MREVDERLASVGLASDASRGCCSMAGGGRGSRDQLASLFSLRLPPQPRMKPVYAITELRPVVEGPPAAADAAQHQHDAIIIDNGAFLSRLRHRTLS